MGGERIRDVWGARTPFARGVQWPARRDALVDVDEADVDHWAPGACVLCSHGCGLDIAVKGSRIVGVRGRVEDPINRGRLGPKGLHGWRANHAADRLLRPLVRIGDDLVETSWDHAMRTVVERSRELLAERGRLSHAFYTSGQLFTEDYYALSMVALAGVGTSHIDGNTRLCTATAAQALKESFGTDGDPGCYEDINHCDTLFLVGHNVAETQTVMWMRMLDRLYGPDRPRLVVVDPRRTAPAAEADVHLPVKSGTNLALLNAIQHELLANGWIDQSFVAGHTVGIESVRRIVDGYTPEVAAEICEVPAERIREAARIIGTAERLVSTVLQGVYQSHQATASAVAVNNINLLQGMIGKPGCTVFQMNGQPTAENTRETGADGDFPAYLNWQNPDHVQLLAERWNVEPLTIPWWSRHTHALQIFRYCEEGSVRFLWITGTNPAVSLPELARIRRILADPRLFVVVNDCFLTETAAFADVVLPVAIWGEKTGTFTNADRTVHLSQQAVPPPGEARTDHDIFLEYSRRMGFIDRDGMPLPPWSTAEEAFDHFCALTRGRPCDQSGLSWAKLHAEGPLRWPVNDEHPRGRDRLYTGHLFNTGHDVCEDYGHDLQTGAANEAKDYRAFQANGRAFLKSARWTPPPESPDEDHPFLLTTGRTVYHWHTRTKTGRTPELQAAAPDVWVEISHGDAARLGLSEGDRVRIESKRGVIEGDVRLGGGRDGTVFVPFHYGYWDSGENSMPSEGGRAANELTITAWDPISRQPYFKHAAVKLTKVNR